MGDRVRQITDLLHQIGELVTDIQRAPQNLPPSTIQPSFVVHNAISAAAMGSPTSHPATSVPSTPTSVLSELRSRFMPYQTPPAGQRSRIVGRPTNRRSEPRNWSNRFFCLAVSTDTKTPNASLRQILASNGLGERVIMIEPDASSQQLRAKIILQYPRLVGVDFELVRGIVGGYGKPLARISTTDAVPNVQYLKASRISTIYIRPSSDLELIDEDSTEEYYDRNNSVASIENSTSRASHSNNGEQNGHESRQELPNASTVTEAIQGSSSGMTGDTITSDHQILTITDFRDDAYASNEGFQHIVIGRDEFLERVFGVYKDPNFNFFKRPRVEFVRESGTDFGALSREYFWKGLLALTQDKIDGKCLFEGEEDHKLPVVDCRLLRSGVYRTVGKFIAHCIIHTGIAFLGLSDAAAEYLTTEEVDEDTPFTITVKDVSDSDFRTAISYLEEIKSGATLSHDKSTFVQEFAISSNFTDRVVQANAAEAIEHMLYHHVIENRKPYLDGIKGALKSTGLLKFLDGRSYLRSSVFPRIHDISYPPDIINDRIVSNDDVVLAYVREYVTRVSEVGSLQLLLRAWTGWPVIPETPLRITVEEECEFVVQTCFNEVKIPSSFTQSDINQYFDLLLTNHEGFGVV